MGNFSFLVLSVMFLISAAIIWLAGISLTKTTDSLDTRLRIGDALGGLILLGVAGSLPEIAIISSAALHGDTAVIIGNLIGGIAIQTLVIVIFDIALKGKRPLSYEAGSKLMFIETIFAAMVTLLALFGTRIPSSNSVLHMNPLSIGVLLAWILGLVYINKARKMPKINDTFEDANPGRKHRERRAIENYPLYAKRSNAYVIFIFLLACLATLIAGVLVERSGTIIAGRLGISSGIFAATIMALVSSLPEISTGLESIYIGDNQLAISDIVGGNAFMPALFIVADLIAKKPVLSFAKSSDILLGGLGIAMMGLYGVFFLIRPKMRFLRMGLDSILQIIVYAGGITWLLMLK